MNYLFLVFVVWYFALLTALVPIFIVLLPFVLISREQRVKRTIYFKLFWAANWLATRPFWTTNITGFDIQTRQHGAAVYVINHQTLFDHIFCHQFGRHKVRTVAKSDLRWYPIVGLVVRFLGEVFVSRSDKRANATAVRQCIDLLRAGVPVQIFPEGTRWWLNNQRAIAKGQKPMAEDELADFKLGAFKMAIEANVPIIPVCAELRHIISDKPFHACRGTYFAHICQPIYPQGRTAEELARLCRKEMLEGMMFVTKMAKLKPI